MVCAWSFCSEIQGIKAEPDQQERYTMERLFDDVSSGDVTRLEDLEKYLSEKNKTLMSYTCKDFVLIFISAHRISTKPLLYVYMSVS